MTSSNTPAQLLLARSPATATAAASMSPAASRPAPRQAGHHSLPSSSASQGLQHRGTHQHMRAPSLPLTVHPTFSKTARMPGTVRIAVQETIFYVHRDILAFGSSFFDALLSGSWLETSNSETASSYVGGSDGLDMNRRWGRFPTVAATAAVSTSHATMAGAATTSSDDQAGSGRIHSTPITPTLASAPDETDDALVTLARTLPELHLEDAAGEAGPDDRRVLPDNDAVTVATSFVEEMQEMGVHLEQSKPDDQDEFVGERNLYEDNRKKVEARIVLKEESAAPFQDLLFFLYPHLDVVIHWNNVAELMTMARKFDIPLLRAKCVSFLMASAAGKPIMAMKVAEEHSLPDLYREASRFVLDNWSNWGQDELTVLSETTLLRLEQRRSWFLERLLKLGLVNTQRDYVCTAACPDPQMCAKILEDKWRSSWSSTFRYGSPSPSSIYRSLRMLEPSLASPALHLPRTSCQNNAKIWVADLFDRMFSLGAPTQRSFATAGAATRAALSDPPTNKKYFLYVDAKI